MRKRLWGDAHPSVATSLNNLALLYDTQGRTREAEPLYQEALAMRKRLWGDAHPSVARSLNNLALLYDTQGRTSDAEPLYLQAIGIAYQQLGERHLNTQTVWNNFAACLHQAMESGKADTLSDHPVTQGLLKHLQSQSEGEQA